MFSATMSLSTFRSPRVYMKCASDKSLGPLLPGARLNAKVLKRRSMRKAQVSAFSNDNGPADHLEGHGNDSPGARELVSQPMPDTLSFHHAPVEAEVEIHPVFSESATDFPSTPVAGPYVPSEDSAAAEAAAFDMTVEYIEADHIAGELSFAFEGLEMPPFSPIVRAALEGAEEEEALRREDVVPVAWFSEAEPEEAAAEPTFVEAAAEPIPAPAVAFETFEFTPIAEMEAAVEEPETYFYSDYQAVEESSHAQAAAEPSFAAEYFEYAAAGPEAQQEEHREEFIPEYVPASAFAFAEEEAEARALSAAIEEVFPTEVFPAFAFSDEEVQEEHHEEYVPSSAFAFSEEEPEAGALAAIEEVYPTEPALAFFEPEAVAGEQAYAAESSEPEPAAVEYFYSFQTELAELAAATAAVAESETAAPELSLAMMEAAVPVMAAAQELVAAAEAAQQRGDALGTASIFATLAEIEEQLSLAMEIGSKLEIDIDMLRAAARREFDESEALALTMDSLINQMVDAEDSLARSISEADALEAMLQAKLKSELDDIAAARAALDEAASMSTNSQVMEALLAWNSDLGAINVRSQDVGAAQAKPKGKKGWLGNLFNFGRK